MRIFEIIQLGGRYLVLGVLLSAIMLAFVYVICRFILKKKEIMKQQLLWWGVFICYIVIVLGATLMERGNFWQTSHIMPLFYSYKDAWISGLAVGWRNIILNICMFMPLGFLLPLGSKYFQSFVKTSITGFFFTLIIEFAQLYFHLGMFELDDLMNNTAGTMIGYGIYVVYSCVILKHSWSIQKVMISQIPLAVVTGGFLVLAIMYQCQELGNLPSEYIIPVDTENLMVSSEIEFSNEISKKTVYECVRLSKQDTIIFANEFFARLGKDIDESRNDFYDETAFFYSNDGNRYSIHINYMGGTYSFTDFDTSFTDGIHAITDASEQEVRDVLKNYGIVIPDEIPMEYVEALDSYQFSFDNHQDGEEMIDGSLVVEYCDNKAFANIRSNLITCKAYKEFEIISEHKAFEYLCAGKFNYRSDMPLDVVIKDCELEYMIDSKGYYQPVYQLLCEINGLESTIYINAIS